MTKTLPTRPLGRTSLELPLVVYGAWAIGGRYWGATRDAAAIDSLRAAREHGMVAIDTAPIYGYGHSERLVGVALDGAAHEHLILSKAGLRWDDPAERGELAFEGPGPYGRTTRVYRNSRPDSVRLECERSLARLGVERLDLLQIHWPDSTTPISDTMGALAELRSEGKVREIGVSNYGPDQLAEAQAALGDIPLASTQPRYSLVHRKIERDVLPWVREHQVGTLIYSPLEQGLLSGKIGADHRFDEGDARAGRGSFQPEARAAINACIDASVRPVAAAHGVTPAQAVLAWTLAQPGVTSVIAGCRDAAQVAENAAAAEVTLTAAECASIDAAFGALNLGLSD